MLFSLITDLLSLSMVVLPALFMLMITLRFGKRQELRLQLFAAWLVLLASFAIGLFCIHLSVEQAKTKQRTILSNLAKSFAATLERMGHERVTLDTPLDDPLRQGILATMRSWQKRTPVFAAIYTLRERPQTGEIYFVCDPGGDYDRNGKIEGEEEAEVEPGTPYNVDASLIPEIISAFQGIPAFSKEPTGDEYGYWVSATEPIYDSYGNVDAVLGVDFWGDDWNNEIKRAKFWSQLFFLSFLFLFFAVQIFLINRRDSETKLKEYAEELEDVVEELVVAKREAEAAVQAKGYFLTNMSHEIKTPMNAILGCSEMLASGQTDPDSLLTQTDMIDIIRKSSKDLMTIIDDILTFSKLDSDHISLENAPVALRRLVDDVKTMMKSKLDEKPQLTFRIKWIDPIPDPILGDATRIRQILINLLSNAIKFTESGSVTVRCSALKPVAPQQKSPSELITEHHSTFFSALATGLFASSKAAHRSTMTRFVGSSSIFGGSASSLKIRSASEIQAMTPGTPFLRIDIIDTGIGLSTEHIGCLFKPFAQGDASPTRKYGGTGLGLGIARGLTRLMGGDITISSELKKGSTFSVLIPLRTVDAPGPEHPHETTEVLEASADLPLLGYRTLVVDDSIVNQLVAAAKLREAGAEVDVASNGQIALEKVAAANDAHQPYRAILMDMQMPVMDGFEATRRLRADGFTAPILAVTANFDSDKQSREAGCNLTLAKPLNRDELIDNLLRLMAGG